MIANNKYLELLGLQDNQHTKNSNASIRKKKKLTKSIYKFLRNQ